VQYYLLALLLVTSLCNAREDPPEYFDLGEVAFVGSMKGEAGNWVAYMRDPRGFMYKVLEGNWLTPGESQIIKITENAVHVRLIPRDPLSGQADEIVVVPFSDKNR